MKVYAVGERARKALVLQLLESLGAPLGQWQCSNLEASSSLQNTTVSLNQGLATMLLCGEQFKHFFLAHISRSHLALEMVLIAIAKKTP